MYRCTDEQMNMTLVILKFYPTLNFCEIKSLQKLTPYKMTRKGKKCKNHAKCEKCQKYKNQRDYDDECKKCDKCDKCDKCEKCEKYKKHQECCFSDEHMFLIRLIYTLAILFWIFFLYYLGIGEYFKCNFLGIFLLALPIIIFLFNVYHIRKIKYSFEKYLMRGNVLYVAFIAIGIFMNWETFKMKTPLLFYKIIYASLIMLALSVLDFWYEDFMICIYLKTVFQTLAVTLLLLALYLYYNQISCEKENEDEDLIF